MPLISFLFSMYQTMVLLFLQIYFISVVYKMVNHGTDCHENLNFSLQLVTS